MGDLEDLIDEARVAAQQPGATDVEIGRLEGLLDIGRARLAAGHGESLRHHAGYLVGHLIRWLHEHGKPLDNAMMVMAAVYGAAVADEGGQQKLAGPGPAVTAHLYAAIRTEMKSGSALDAADERMLFGWLLEQTSIATTPLLLGKLERLRTQRLERTGLRAEPP